MSRLATSRPLRRFVRMRVMRAGVWAMGRVSQSRLVPERMHRPVFNMATRIGQSVPPGVSLSESRIANVPVEQLSTSHKPHPGQILYLHGGAYVLGSASTHRGITARLCALTGQDVLAVSYRLAPEHRFPAAVEDVRAVYAALLAQGAAPNNIMLAGDSAGGGLAIAAALAIRDAGLPLPAGIAALSPWANLDDESVGLTRPQRDLMLSREYLASAAARYLGDAATSSRHPWASPVHADLRGLPPMLIQVDEGELLYEDARQLAAAAQRAGVKVELQCWQGLWHVWQFFAGHLEEADQALEEIADFVKQTTTVR